MHGLYSIFSDVNVYAILQRGCEWVAHMTFLDFLQVIAVICGLTGSVLVSEQKASGFYVWIISNFALIYIAYASHTFITMLLFIAYLFTCFRGIYKWRKKDNRQEVKPVNRIIV